MKGDYFLTIETPPIPENPYLWKKSPRFQPVLRERATGLEPATFSLEG